MIFATTLAMTLQGACLRGEIAWRPFAAATAADKRQVAPLLRLAASQGQVIRALERQPCPSKGPMRGRVDSRPLRLDLT
jgi:hypothetical protein